MHRSITTTTLIVSPDGRTVRSKWRGHKPARDVLSASEALEALRAGDVAIVAQSDARAVKEAYESEVAGEQG